MSSKPIIFGQPAFDQEELELAAEVIRSGWVGQGPLVERFERELGTYLRSTHVVTVSSCTAALELALRAAGIGPDDEVITTPLTFVATVNAIESTGATPVLVDVDGDSLLLTPESVAVHLSERTRAVVPVSFGGRPLDLPGFVRLAEAHDLWIVEDAAHSVGAIADGLPVGADRHPRLATCFSFYPNKNLASAEGGAVATPSGEIADLLRSLRLHGLDVDAWQRYRTNAYRPSLAKRYGTKSNWTDLQAALALPQLAKLEGFLATREFLAEAYDERLAAVPGVHLIDRPSPSLRWRHGLHLYQVRVDAARRDRVIQGMREREIGATLHYFGVNLHPQFAPRFTGPFPESDRASHELVTLPLHPSMHLDDVERVVAALGAELR